MFLVQLLLPQFHQDGSRVAHDQFAAIRRELTDRFGGVTAYLRSPAKGLWKGPNGVEADDMVMVEVQVEFVDLEWWTTYRRTLERALGQKTILIRAIKTEML